MAHFRASHHSLRHLLSHCRSSTSDRITNPLLVNAHGVRFRKLEVILTTSIDKLGKAGETVKVAPGYFRNHLMPKLLAVPNIDKFAFLIREQRQLYQREEEEEIVMDQTSETADDIDTLKEIKMKEYQTAAVRLNKALLVLRRHIKIDNELREPVENDDLVAEVARQLNINIHPDNLHLPSPISSLGQYTVPLRLPREIPCPVGTLQWKLDVKIRRK